MQIQKRHKSQEALRHAIHAMLGNPLESLDCRKTVYDGWRKSLMSRNDVTDLGVVGVGVFFGFFPFFPFFSKLVTRLVVLRTRQVYHLLLKAPPRLAFFRVPTSPPSTSHWIHVTLHRCKELCRAIFNGALAFGFLLHGHSQRDIGRWVDGLAVRAWGSKNVGFFRFSVSFVEVGSRHLAVRQSKARFCRSWHQKRLKFHVISCLKVSDPHLNCDRLCVPCWTLRRWIWSAAKPHH